MHQQMLESKIVDGHSTCQGHCRSPSKRFSFVGLVMYIRFVAELAAKSFGQIQAALREINDNLMIPESVTYLGQADLLRR